MTVAVYAQGEDSARTRKVFTLKQRDPDHGDYSFVMQDSANTHSGLVYDDGSGRRHSVFAKHEIIDELLLFKRGLLDTIDARAAYQRAERNQGTPGSRWLIDDLRSQVDRARRRGLLSGESLDRIIAQEGTTTVVGRAIRSLIDQVGDILKSSETWDPDGTSDTAIQIEEIISESIEKIHAAYDPNRL